MTLSNALAKSKYMTSTRVQISPTFLPHAQNISVICKVGNYVTNNACQQCPIDTYSDQDDATECTKCSEGKKSVAGSTASTDCKDKLIPGNLVSAGINLSQSFSPNQCFSKFSKKIVQS